MEKKDYTDSRFYVLPKDKETKNGSATIRFLPATDGDAAYKVEVYEHSMKFPKPNSKPGYFIENCPSTVGGKCPACDEYFKGWEANKGLPKAQWDRSCNEFKRKTQWITNILVVKDELKPENEGKVFLFKYGIEIQELLEQTEHPENMEGYDPEVDAPGFNPRNMYEGANLRLRLTDRSDKGGDTFKTYKTSKFLSQGPVSDDEAVIAKIWESQYSLAEFEDKDAVDFADKKTPRFKTYAQLKERLEKAMGIESDAEEEQAQTAVETTTVAKTRITKQPIEEDDDVVEDDDEAEIARMVEEMKNGNSPL